jgi:hypothetical protein
VWIAKKGIEQAMKRGKIDRSGTDSRTMMRDESEDDFEGGKTYL